jgi:(hydroxyamino)benzene mutase
MTDTFGGAAASSASAGSGQAARHPFDPDQARSTKAAAILALGVAAVLTGPLVGGIVPATLALILARQARGDLIAGKGYLTGSGQIRLGLTLAWIGIALAAGALVAASVVGILSSVATTGQDFPNTSN